MSGPLTKSDLMAIWVSAVDKSYSRPIIDAGEGQGLEAYTQLMVQLERAALAADITTQALFILPSSAQTAPPAQGEAFATVTLSFSRTNLLDRPLVLEKGLIFVEEQTTTDGENGPETFLTQRRYVLSQTLVFMPGDMGPFDVAAVAEKSGYGFNNPLPGTIKFVPQPGSGFNHDFASVTFSSGDAPPAFPAVNKMSATIASINEADMFVPEHIGQYVQLTAGANLGKIGRMLTFVQPDPSVPVGSTVSLETMGTVDTPTYSGTFQPGERVSFASGGPVLAWGVLAAERVVGARKRLAFVVLNGNPFTATTVTGASSGATAAVQMTQPMGGGAGTQFYTAESGTASWKVLDWVSDWGLSVINVLSPTGGRAAMLDALGYERNISRSPGEDDDRYRARIAQIADVVTPNAIKRTLNRTLVADPWEFDEVGSPGMPGIFYDGDKSGPHLVAGGAVNDAYDLDVLLLNGGVPNTTTSASISSIATSFNVANANNIRTAKYISVNAEIMLVTSIVTNTVHVVRGVLGTTAASHPFAGQTVKSVFEANEPLRILDSSATTIKATGFYGTDTGALMTFIHKDNDYTWVSGDVVHGVNSGALWNVTSVTSTADAPKFKTYLDYAQFRGFFMIGVAKKDLGDFGFAYDTTLAGQYNAYDSSPYITTFDGFPAGNSAYYRQIYQAVDRVRAGGVGFDLFELP